MDAGVTRPRGKGRPQKNSTADARETLIAATRSLLRTHPPSQINRLDIARLAGVDPALVRYYFSDKEQLLRETATQMMTALRQRRASAQRSETTFRGKLRAYLHFLIEALHEYPFLHDLLLGQIERVGSVEAGDLRRDFIDEPLGEVRSMVERAVESGEIRPLDVSFFYVAMIGMCSFPMRHRMLLEQVMQSRPVTTEVASAYADFAADLLMRGIARTEAD